MAHKHNLTVIHEVEEEGQFERGLEQTDFGTDKSGKERLRVVARCSIIASLASFVSGINVGFSSPALLELTNENMTTSAQYIGDGDAVLSTFGVGYYYNGVARVLT